MKTSTKKVIIALSCLLCLLIGLLTFAACNNGEQFTVALDAGDGSLNQTAIKAEKGTSLLAAVGDIVPKADGLVFDEWLLNGQPIKEEDKVGGNITLTASYKALYRVEVYYQNADKTNYVQDDGKTVVGYGKLGESVSPTIAEVDGYTLNREMSTDAGKVLAKGENLLKYFYARADRTITYAALLDDGEEKIFVNTYSGAIETIADCTFARPGYAFMGWSQDIGLSADDAFAVGKTINVSGNVVLYAQWGVEYNEAYKSGDTVVVGEFADKNGIIPIILNSADGTQTKGSFDRQTKFFDAEEKKGQVDDEYGQFIYDVTGKYLGYSLLGGATNEKYGTLELNALTGDAKYVIGSKEITGKYQELRLSSGAFSGEKYFSSSEDSFYFCFLDSEENPNLDTSKYAGEFFRRGEEAGTYVVIDMSGGKFDTPYVYNIDLDGYGNLEFPIPSFMNIANAYGSYSGYNEETGEWKYVYEGQLFQDTVGEYPKEFIFKAGYLTSLAGSYSENPDGSINADGEILSQIPIVVIYDDKIAGVYQTEDGAKIEMDGYGNAVYTPAAGDAIEGYVSFKGLTNTQTNMVDLTNNDCAAEGGNLSTLEHFWKYEDTVVSISFSYYDETETERSMVMLCRNRSREIRSRWDDDFVIVKEADKELVGIDAAKEAGSYRIAHNEEDFIDFRLDGNGLAELSLIDGGSKITTWLADGTYEMTGENEGSFTVTDATQSLAYLGVAAGAFNFRLIDVDGNMTFIVCDETIKGSYGTVAIDGYGKLTDNGVAYTYKKLGNNVLMAQDESGNVVMYTVAFGGDGSISKITPSANGALVGEYLTVVKDNALYIGPGKLVFDGNGRALFYEMANGEYIGEGLYTYDAVANRGRFITAGEMQFFVESFDFCITTMKDSDGIVNNVYIKYDVSKYAELEDENGATLTLDGFGFAIYNDGTDTIKSQYNVEDLVYSGMAIGGKLSMPDNDSVFLVDIENGMFAKEAKLGYYFGVRYDAENDAYMLDDSSMLLLLGEFNGNMGQMGELLNPGAENLADIEYAFDEEDEDVITITMYDEDYNETYMTVKLVKIPAYDEFEGNYYVDAYLVYQDQLAATYNNPATGETIAVDSYGNVVYTDKSGNVFNVEFYNVTITETSMFIEIEDERFTEPSHMLTVNYNADDNTFTTSNEAGSYVRYYNDDFYYPMLNMYGYDETEGDYMFLLIVPQTVNGQTELIPYAIGTYDVVHGQDNVYELTFTGKTEDFGEVAHLFPTDSNTFRVKFAYVDNDKGAYSTYIIIDENEAGEYTLDDTTFSVDGFGSVTTSSGKQGSADRVGDVLVVEIDGQTSYYNIGANNELTVADYVVYIEFIK